MTSFVARRAKRTIYTRKIRTKISISSLFNRAHIFNKSRINNDKSNEGKRSNMSDSGQNFESIKCAATAEKDQTNHESVFIGENQNLGVLTVKALEEFTSIARDIRDSLSEVRDSLSEVRNHGRQWQIRMEALDPSSLTKLWASEEQGCRDIWELYILPLLNGTDRKLFYEVNTDTRAALKRANVVLPCNFLIKELASRSTMELAWKQHLKNVENLDNQRRNQGYGGNTSYGGSASSERERSFFAKVAATGILSLVRWCKEEKKCAWDGDTLVNAAATGNIDLLTYFFVNGGALETNQGVKACAAAAENGHLLCLIYLRETKKIAVDTESINKAANGGHFDVVKYLLENSCPVSPLTCASAAENGHLKVLQYLHGKLVAWDVQTCRFARKNNHLDCLNYALGNGCPSDI
jgi:hypothetical protein